MNSVPEPALQLCTQMAGFIIEHFAKVEAKTEECAKRALRELELFRRFLRDIHTVGSQYERAVFRLCEDFQHSMKDHHQDEKLSQYFQLVINGILRHGDEVQKRFEVIGGLEVGLAAAAADFDTQINRNLEAFETSLNNFRVKQIDFEETYKTYVHTISAATRASPAEAPAPFELQEVEDRTAGSFTDLQAALRASHDLLKQILRESAEKEAEVKSGVRDAAVKLLNTISPAGGGELALKATTLEDHLESFRCHFDELRRENALEFNRVVSLSAHQLRFYSFRAFSRLEAILELPAARTAAQRLGQLAKLVSAKIRVYVEILLETLYATSFDFTREIWEEVGFLMNGQATREYLLYALCVKKAQVLGERPAASIYLKNEQVRNLAQLAGLFLGSFRTPAEVNYELVLGVLKLGLTVFNEQKECLLELLARAAIVREPEFWRRVMACAGAQAKSGGPEGGPRPPPALNSPFLHGLKLLVENIKSNAPGLAAKASGAAFKAFEDTLFVLLHFRLGFEVLSEVLLALAAHTSIPFDQVRLLLQRHQEQLMFQIASARVPYARHRDFLARLARPRDRAAKLLVALPHVAEFLDEPGEVMRLAWLGRRVFQKRRKFFRAVIAGRRFAAERPAFRRALFSALIEPGRGRAALESDIPHQYDTIIGLDVKRTYCESAFFNSASLQLILQNLAHPKVGNFAYYQGLNYLTGYFLVLFEGDPLRTFGFMNTLLERRFAAYIDLELRNLKKIFYILKRLTRMFLPVLFNYLEKDQKLDMDIVFASWCLTIFTTVTQYEARSPLLDEVIDLFAGEGWVGFCKVVLVILRGLAPRAMRLSYEELLVFYTDLAKTNFRELRAEAEGDSASRKSQAPKPFSFKRKVRMFRQVNRRMILALEEEYVETKEKLDEFWERMAARAKTK